MSVKIEASVLNTPESLGSLETTPATMHKLYFEIADTKTWYAIMKDARAQFGKNWRGQQHVKRRLDSNRWRANTVERVWFEVPDPKFGTWVGIKHAVRQIPPPGK